MYGALADYKPSNDEVKALPLKEGQTVEVLDADNPDRWLCRDANNKTQQG